jgi:hypothetical protein
MFNLTPAASLLLALLLATPSSAQYLNDQQRDQVRRMIRQQIRPELDEIRRLIEEIKNNQVGPRGPVITTPPATPTPTPTPVTVVVKVHVHHVIHHNIYWPMPPMPPMPPFPIWAGPCCW